MRVFELARELAISSKELMALCKGEGIDVSNHMNALPPESIDRLRAVAAGEPAEAKEKKIETPVEQGPPEQVPEEASLPEPETPRSVTIPPGATVKDLAGIVGVKPNELIAKLMTLGVFATINQTLESEELELVAAEFGLDATVKEAPEEKEEDEEPSMPENLEPRAPVVTFMGHVDHGKTSLLDRIRQTDVASGEKGGITQHIGAYAVETGNGKHVVFLDTPGHAAFTAMRARGANVTDVVVLVVAADDGVMPQTREAIDHAKAAGVPVVVAINKIDLPNANIPRVKQQLAAAELNPEEWGGTTIVVEVSAETGENMDELLEMLALQSEILELKADPTKAAGGTVLEIERSSKKGVTAHLLVQKGTLRKGDAIVCGSTYGKVRALRDHIGKDIRKAGPSTPVEITGLQDVPEAGDRFRVFENLPKARQTAEKKQQERQKKALTRRKHVTLETLYASIAAGSLRELRLIIKADVHGSLEALEGALRQLRHDELRMSIIHQGVGGINESDILLADASDAIVIGFHVVCTAAAAALAEKKGVDVETYGIIYEIVDSIRSALEGMLEPEKKEIVVGRLTIRAIFKISRLGTAAGCYVDNGTVSRRNSVRIVRDGIVIYNGSLASLKRFKDDVSEVQAGYECGLRLAGYDDIKVGDVLEAIQIEEIAKKLS